MAWPVGRRSLRSTFLAVARTRTAYSGATGRVRRFAIAAAGAGLRGELLCCSIQQQQQQRRHATVGHWEGPRWMVTGNNIHATIVQHTRHHRPISNDAKSPAPKESTSGGPRPGDLDEGVAPWRFISRLMGRGNILTQQAFLNGDLPWLPYYGVARYVSVTPPQPATPPPPPLTPTPTNPPPSSPTPSTLTDTIQAARQRVATTLTTPHENIYNLPNALTLTRLLAAPTTAYLLLHDHHNYALALFFYAGVTDLVDGYIARRWRLQTVAGSVIDPMADKALMIILTVTLAVKGALPAYLAALILGRDATLAVAAIYYRYASLPAPKSFMRYWDFSLPSAEVHPTTVSKYNTFLQLVLIGSTIAMPVVTAGGQYAGLLGVADASLYAAMHAYQVLVAATTVWSGLSYAFLKNAVTILGTDETLKAKQGWRGRAIIGVAFGSVVAGAAWLALRDGEEVEGREVEGRKGGQVKRGELEGEAKATGQPGAYMTAFRQT